VSKNGRVAHPLRSLQRVGFPIPIWQPRFYDFHVWSDRKRIEKLRYMHRNPVGAGLVQEPEQWAWSSHRSYAFNEEGIVKINQWPKAEMRVHPAA
jgi:hypothetical protein